MDDKSKRKIFGLEPDQLDNLFSLGTGNYERSKPDKESAELPKPSASSGFSDSSDFTASLESSIEYVGQWIGPYKLVSTLGEGGMGIVYLAEQEHPIKRKVALKVIKPGMDSKRVIARFEAERQALALLDHPNIAHVYDAGTTESGRPYFVMEYVEGLTITEHCDQNKLSINERLRLFLQVCHAVQHAHQKGIIHRDIKPSNILVSLHGDQALPKIIDFGVAKALAQPLTEQTLVTEQGQLFGTPEYMSPEQADMASDDIDTRSDIYSLGVLLYVLLTGVLPFDSKELRESGIEHIQQVIRETDPKTPSTRLTKLGDEAKKVAEKRGTEVAALAKCLHKELEWIPLKAMRKERSERYRSAVELADDIENYLNGNPLIASAPSTAYLLKKFIQRNRAVVAGIAAVLVVLLVGIFISTIFAIEAEKAAQELQHTLYAHSIQLAGAKYQQSNMRDMRDLLLSCPEDLRGWEWYYLWRVSDQSLMTLRGHEDRVHTVAFSPDGSLIVSGSSDNTLKVWDANKGTELITLRWHEGRVDAVAFSPDGSRIFSGSWDGKIKVWDVYSGSVLMTLEGHEQAVESVAFSPDGSRIVSGSWDKTLKVWDVYSGSVLMTLKGHESPVWSVAFSPDGSRIVSGSRYNTLKVWDASSGKELMTMGHEHFDYGAAYTMSVAFSSDGSRIVSCVANWNTTISIWDADSGSELMTLQGDEGTFGSLALSPDGSRIVSGGAYGDNTLKVWDANSGEKLMTLQGHEDTVSSVAFSPDGRRIVSGSFDNMLKVWDLNSVNEEMILHGHEEPVRSVAFSPDGSRIVSGSFDNTLKVWDANKGTQLMTLTGHENSVWSVAFSPDGRRIVSGTHDMKLKIWDANNGKILWTLHGHEGPVVSVAFSPDGGRIVSGSQDKTLKVWDANTGTDLLTLKGHQGWVWSVAFSPDGNRIVSGSWDGKIKVWDAYSGSVLTTIKGHEKAVESVAFSPDGSRIVSGSQDKKIKVWDANTGNELKNLLGHDATVLSVAFSPDGSRIVSGSWDTTLKVWDFDSRRELITLQKYEGTVESVAFSPDGRRIVSGCRDGTIRFWNIASPEEVAAELQAEEKGQSWIRID